MRPWARGVRCCVTAVLGLTTIGLLGARALGSGRQTSFRATVDLIRVDTTVLDGNVPVPNLSAREFRLTDNGVEQAVQAVAIEGEPIDVTLLVDTSGSTAGELGTFRTSVRRLAGLLRPIDRVRLVTAASQVDEVFGMQSPNQPIPVDAIRTQGLTAINDGLIYAFAWDPGPDRRHLIVAFTDGEDNESISSSDLILGVASRVDAVLHVVLSDSSSRSDPRQPIPLRDFEQASRAAFVEAAKRTGGEIHEVADTVKAFKAIFEEYRQSYTLYYTPHGVSASGWHDIVVAVTTAEGSRLTVRARKGYVGG